MPNQGASSGFKYGGAVGAIEAVLACCEIPMTGIEPSAWKKGHRLRGKDKEGGWQTRLAAVSCPTRAACAETLAWARRVGADCIIRGAADRRWRYPTKIWHHQARLRRASAPSYGQRRNPAHDLFNRWTLPAPLRQLEAISRLIKAGVDEATARSYYQQLFRAKEASDLQKDTDEEKMRRLPLRINKTGFFTGASVATVAGVGAFTLFFTKHVVGWEAALFVTTIYVAYTAAAILVLWALCLGLSGNKTTAPILFLSAAGVIIVVNIAFAAGIPKRVCQADVLCTEVIRQLHAQR
jgi:hypothetical protein